MFSIIGIVVVFGCIAAGYLMEHGSMKVLVQPAELIIIENSKLLEALGLHERESFGLISYADYLRTQKDA